MKQGDRLIVDIIDLDYTGSGVAKVDGFPIFIPLALPNEKVDIVITHVSKQVARGELISVLRPSNQRTTPSCPFFEACGGCDLMHMSYETQVQFKTDLTRDTLKRIGQATHDIYPILPSVKHIHYRNHIQLHVKRYKNKTIIGYYGKNSHEVILTQPCQVADPAINLVYLALVEYLQNYDAFENAPLNHVTLRCNQKGDVMMTLITSIRKAKVNHELIKRFSEPNVNVVSIYVNENPMTKGPVLGHKSFKIYGKDVLIDTLNNLDFSLSPNAFYQINPAQAEALYQTVFDLGELKKTDVVVDAYCGIGTMSLLLGLEVKKVHGIEMSKAAIKNARTNQRYNLIENVTFHEGLVEDVLPVLVDHEKIDVMIVDPPRKGLANAIIQTIQTAKVHSLIYVSCNQRTLARDCALLLEAGYAAISTQPIDMFPQVSDIESVTLFKRKK